MVATLSKPFTSVAILYSDSGNYAIPILVKTRFSSLLQLPGRTRTHTIVVGKVAV